MECIITKKQKYFWTNSRWCGRPHLQLVLMLYIFLCQSSTPHACSSLLYRETWYTETFTRWPAIDRRAADKSDHCGNLYLSPHCLPWNTETPSSLPWSDVLKCIFQIHRGCRTIPKADKTWNKDPISDVWSHKGRERKHKSTQLHKTSASNKYMAYYSSSTYIQLTNNLVEKLEEHLVPVEHNWKTTAVDI